MNCSFEADIYSEPVDPIHKTETIDSLTNETDLFLEVCPEPLYTVASEDLEYDI